MLKNFIFIFAVSTAKKKGEKDEKNNLAGTLPAYGSNRRAGGRTDVSKWLLKRVMLNDPDPAEEEECESSPLGIVTMLKAAVAATALWAMMSAIIILLG